MRSRMDRYYNEEQDKKYTRSNKNQELYKNIGSNTKYTNFTDVTNANVFDIGEARQNYHTRQGYQRMREYDEMISTPKVKKELDEFNYLYQDHENRVYDINSVLKEAKENRIEKDELEAKRKLKNTNYNILASLNPKELEKYRKEKTERARPDEDELRDLIDTITSKTLAGELSKEAGVDLLSDLMATSVMDKVEDDSDEDDEIEEKLSLSKEILDKDQLDKVSQIKEEEKTDDDIMKNADSDFYTRSMDLSGKDFEMDDEFSDASMPLVVKIFLVLIIIAALAVTGLYVYKKFM
ncbi:MAG: hypothetical protein E7160_04515 [Firmicutes bacterium]|nr:hypothetical protein [Bacillota bacterium]